MPATALMSAETLNALLLDWKEAKEILDAAKEKEMSLRKVIVDESGLFDPSKESGTQNYDLGNGWKIKAVKKVNYAVNNQDGICFSVLAQIAALDEVSAFLARDLFGFTPSLRKSKYDELNPAARRLADTIIVSSSGAPSLELIGPKE